MQQIEIAIYHRYICRECYVLPGVCLSVCLSVCLLATSHQDYWTTDRNFVKIFTKAVFFDREDTVKIK